MFLSSRYMSRSSKLHSSFICIVTSAMRVLDWPIDLTLLLMTVARVSHKTMLNPSQRYGVANSTSIIDVAHARLVTDHVPVKRSRREKASVPAKITCTALRHTDCSAFACTTFAICFVFSFRIPCRWNMRSSF